MAALAGNFYVLGYGFLADLATVFLARLHHATAWQVRTLLLVIGGHEFILLFQFSTVVSQSTSQRLTGTPLLRCCGLRQ
jgi:hypothetical protein